MIPVAIMLPVSSYRTKVLGVEVLEGFMEIGRPLGISLGLKSQQAIKVPQ